MKEEGLGGFHMASMGQRIREWLGLQKNSEDPAEAGFHEFFKPFTFMIVLSVFSVVFLISLDIEEEWIESWNDPGLKFCLVWMINWLKEWELKGLVRFQNDT